MKVLVLLVVLTGMASAWYSGWTNCTDITLNKATIANQSHAIALNSTVINYLRLQSDLKDLRFFEGTCYAAHSGTSLDQWIESVNTTGNSYVWFDTVNASITAVSMFYNNVSATDISDISSIGLYTDDFSTNTSAEYSFQPSDAQWYFNTSETGTLQANVTGASQSGWAILNISQSENVSVYSVVRIDAIEENENLFGGIALDHNNQASNSERYRASLLRGAHNDRLYDLDAQIAWSNFASFTWSAGTWYKMKSYQTASSFSSKAWGMIASEPAWMASDNWATNSNEYAGLVCEPYDGNPRNIQCSYDLWIAYRNNDPAYSFGAELGEPAAVTANLYYPTNTTYATSPTSINVSCSGASDAYLLNITYMDGSFIELNYPVLNGVNLTIYNPIQATGTHSIALYCRNGTSLNWTAVTWTVGAHALENQSMAIVQASGAPSFGIGTVLVWVLALLCSLWLLKKESSALGSVLMMVLGISIIPDALGLSVFGLSVMLFSSIMVMMTFSVFILLGPKNDVRGFIKRW